jgi:large subunit ribosomal protein L9
MQVILLERIEKLGQMGDVVTVKNGYARNFLLPKGKALRATDANKERFTRDRAQLEARNLELKKEAEAVSAGVAGKTYLAIRQAGESGQLYGSVSTRDIAEIVTEAGASITRAQVLLDHPIKTLGLHEVRIQLHPEVIVSVTLNVARSAEEAELQARGEEITAETRRQLAEGELGEDAVAPEEVFEEGAWHGEDEAAAGEEDENRKEG